MGWLILETIAALLINTAGWWLEPVAEFLTELNAAARQAVTARLAKVRWEAAPRWAVINLVASALLYIVLHPV